jgi:hypothetical protein
LPVERVLTARCIGFRGNLKQYDYGLLVATDKINDTVTKAGSPRSNGIVVNHDRHRGRAPCLDISQTAFPA